MSAGGTTTADTELMARAIQLASLGRYTTMPNPCVGAVIAVDGEIVGEGWHRKAGQPHAEVMALRQAGQRASGATVYVTLEPCSHQGRTPPCADALIAAGVSRVVYGMADPNPLVAGQGLQRLEKAGIATAGPVLEAAARNLNPGFVKRHETGLPWVTIKLAMSLDGRTAMASGESQWITGPEARSDVQRLRAMSCAIVTGVGTVANDNPALTVRENELHLPVSEQVTAAEVVSRQPLRVVVGDASSLSAQAAVFCCTADQQTLLATRNGQTVGDAQLLQLADSGGGKVDLRSVLQGLVERNCNRVLVEAGAGLSGAFFSAGLVDELIIYMAPTLMGSEARPLLTLPYQQMAQQQRLQINDMRAVGDDWRITLTRVEQG